jgi:hypothetical protein
MPEPIQNDATLRVTRNRQTSVTFACEGFRDHPAQLRIKIALPEERGGEKHGVYPP